MIISNVSGRYRAYTTVYLLDKDGNPDLSQERILSLPISTAKKISDILQTSK